MSFPINGRIIIIDDQVEQALPLIKYLSKYNYSFKYFNGSISDLPNPDQGFDDIRVVFLDLNLLDNKRPDRTHFSMLKGVLNRIIKKVSHPYLLVAWTRHDDDIGQLDSYVFEETDNMHLKKPFSIVKANKLDFFDLDGIEQEVGDYNKLKLDLENKFKNFPELACLFKWENINHNITNEIASDFFPSSDSYEEWATKTKSILNLFAKASIGRHYNISDDTTKVNAAFEVINQLFMDKLETSFYSLTHEIVLSQQDSSIDLSPLEINTKLLTGTPIKKDTTYPGTVVTCENEDLKLEIFKKIILRDPGADFFSDLIFEVDFNELSEQSQQLYIGEYYSKNAINYEELGKDEQKEARKSAISFLRGAKHNVEFKQLSKSLQRDICLQKKNSLIKDATLIEVCIDPLCDYVQQKAFFPKIAKGLIVKNEIRNLIDLNTEALYISPSFNYGATEVFIALDYRYLQTLNENKKSEIVEPNIVFRLRSSLLADIQSKLSRHVNRQGILFL
ncbi:hypothetical protein [Acinetobacter nosocomialis]